MFHLRRDRIIADQPRCSGIVFECALENRAQRKAIVLSHEYELWVSKGVNDPSPEFVARLSFDLSSGSIWADPLPFEPNRARPMKLIWHFSANQLQRVEEVRQGAEPWFQIRSRLTVTARSMNPDGTLRGDPYFAEEFAFDSNTNGYPVRFKIDHEEWARILRDVGFSHIVLQELAIPVFPPEFKRAQGHLKDAWDYHRAGHSAPALSSCFKAFECLGFELTGSGSASRNDVVELLMDGKEEAKKAKVIALWKAVGEYCHMGRHDKDAPVHLNHRDAELAVVSATILLRYLAEP